MVRHYDRGVTFLKGEVLERISPDLYTILVDGATWRRHVDQMRGSEGAEYEDFDYSSTQAPSEMAGPSSELNEAAVPSVQMNQRN